jgi:tetratricopeptide (TPR) repeat protein
VALAVMRIGLMCTLLLCTAAPCVHAQVANAAAPAQVDDQEARDLFKLGKQAFDEGRFERALKYFKDSYDLSQRATLLSSIGSTLDRLRRDREALAAYQQYLQEVPDAPNRTLIEERVRILQAALPHPAATPEAPTPNPPPAAVVVATPAAAAQTQVHPDSAPALATAATPRSSDSPAITSRWWFWAGIGTVAAAAIVVGVVASSSGSNTGVESPALLGATTRVRDL